MNPARAFALCFSGFCVIAIALMLAGCGKKGDPVASAMKPAPPVSVLKLEKTAEGIIARWPVSAGRAGTGLFQVEKSTLSPQDADCVGCPRTFDVIAHIGVNDPACREGNAPVCRYTDYNVVSGYHYVYRILSCDDAGRCEPSSSPAEIIFKN